MRLQYAKNYLNLKASNRFPSYFKAIYSQFGLQFIKSLLGTRSVATVAAGARLLFVGYSPWCIVYLPAQRRIKRPCSP